MNDVFTKLKELAISKKLNILLGAGASMPAIPTIQSFKKQFSQLDGKELDEKELNEKLLEHIKTISQNLISNDYENDPNQTSITLVLNTYEDFIRSITNILYASNSRQVPRTANIFTTNYDLFLEKAVDTVMQEENFIFNDGAKGYFTRYLDSANFNISTAYRGLNDNYNIEVPAITLIKPHGSVNWARDKKTDRIIIKDHCDFSDPVVVLPDQHEERQTFLDNHFHEMLRVFQMELDKPQSVLFVLGFSFGDKHIAKMVCRALRNRELMVYCLCHSDKDKETIQGKLNLRKIPPNLVLYGPSDLEMNEITLSVLNEIFECEENTDE